MERAMVTALRATTSVYRGSELYRIQGLLAANAIDTVKIYDEHMVILL